jgi:serine/threonine-protein kinase
VYKPAPVRGPGPAYAGEALQFVNLRPEYVSVRQDGTLYVSGYANAAPLYWIDADGTAVPVVGDKPLATLSAEAGALIPGAGQVDWDDAGNLYVPDINGYRIVKIDSKGVVTPVAGNGTPGFSGDGGPATQAQISRIEEVAVLGDGTVYFADDGNQRIRKVTPDGVITTIAGTGQPGFSRGPTTAASAKLGGPNTIEDAPDGSLYVTNIVSGTVQRIDPAGRLTTVAGVGGWDISSTGRSNEGGRATGAKLTTPSVGLGPDGSLYIVSPPHANVRKVGPDGIIRTIAGTGHEGADGDGGPAMVATFLYPRTVAVDVTGAVYVADSGNYRVRRISSDGTVTTVVTSS